MTATTQRLHRTHSAPEAAWVTIPDLHEDPFPIYRRMREESPIHWVPAVNRYMVTGYSACHLIENDQDIYSADETNSLMKRAMGHSMLRKDDPEHDTDRRSYGGVLRPRAIKETWNAIFAKNCETYLRQLREAGPGSDLIRDFAAPYAAENLREVMGFYNATQADMQRWSQTMMDGTGNYADDPDVWALSDQSFNEVDDAIDEILPYLRKNPDASLLSKMADMPIPMDAIRANMKMTIGGGLNEPRDVLGVAVWALLSRPAQLAQVLADSRMYGTAFDEAVRWVAPIGMYPRETTCDAVLEGIALPKGARLGVVVGAANRDPAIFTQPDDFDINRDKKPHLAFGGGNHFCAGAWVARAAVADIALPQLFAELPNLRIDPTQAPTAAGWVFRGMTSLSVRWD
ncbi:cytochrome P450 [Rhodococcus wratislaviensis]|uniref:Cytochrome P450 n=1 Tax=Rhodococcus wratislaviensis NBRC 100605 TaxID=1219028 RepID=X0PL34_RHOWR|nr:cytochrome P450 [Rhodococcus wratislaviensis]GAF43149.1 hypothetical protein RW1_006_00410 [Rhodococcus wratislaviensis NBRC 100605]